MKYVVKISQLRFFIIVLLFIPLSLISQTASNNKIEEGIIAGGIEKELSLPSYSTKTDLVLWIRRDITIANIN